MHHRALGALALLVSALPARAQAPEVDLSLLRPATGADGTIAVEGARPLPDGVEPIELQLLFDAAWNPVRDPLARVDRRLGGWIALQGRLDPGLSLSVQIPITLRQDGDLSALGGPASLGNGLGDVRVGARASLLSSAVLAAAAQVTVEFATSQPQALTGDARVGVEALVSVSRRVSERIELLGNALVRFRPPRDLGAARFGNQIGLRGALVYSLSEPLRAFGEVEAQTSLRQLSVLSAPAELRAGLRGCVLGRFALEGAIGTRLDAALGAPDARALLSLRYAPAACQPPRGAELEAETKAVLEQLAAARAQRDALARAEAEAARSAARVALGDALAAAEAEAAANARALRAADEKDSDGDGIPDVLDNCPFEKGPVINRGCPMARRQVVAIREDRIDILEKIQFAYASARLRKRSHRLLDQVVSVLQTHPDLVRVQVEGHTDSIGGARRNTELSQARAESVVAYLVAHGIDPSRLLARGFGPSRPLASNATAVGREANRRVEFRVLERRATVRIDPAP